MTMNVPNSGQGLHDFILKYTRHAILSRKSKNEVYERTWMLTCRKGRAHSILEKEINDAIDGAVEWCRNHPHAVPHQTWAQIRAARVEYDDWFGSDGIRRAPPAPKWVMPINHRLIEWIHSRPMCGRPKSQAKFNLGDLYANFNFPICLAPEVNLPIARRLEFWRKQELDEIQWIVPNPCLKCGNGGYFKSEQNAGERIWVIIEFDSGTFEEQLKRLFWLERVHAEWNLCMIVSSGNKSYHGWFSCVDMLERREIFKFFRIATSIGCDKMMRSSVQYTRFPLGINRKRKKLQEIIHWNQDAIDQHNENLRKS